MADNYLEKQYEFYLARKAAWEKQKKLGVRKKHPAGQGRPTPTPPAGEDSSPKA